MTPTRLILAIFILCCPAALPAQVQIQFYSKDSGKSFPHAFVRLTGSVEGSGEAIDTNYGFTAARVSPAILVGAVNGKIQTVDPQYVSRSDSHFALWLNDEQYRRVQQVVEKWRALPQPSYRLNSQNCVFFVADVASALGLKALPVPQLMKKPRSYLAKVTADNSALIASWNRPQDAAPQQTAAVPSAN